jgi:hypothetical protein
MSREIHIEEYPNPMAEMIDMKSDQFITVRTLEDCEAIINSMVRMANEIDPDWQGMDVK